MVPNESAKVIISNTAANAPAQTAAAAQPSPAAAVDIKEAADDRGNAKKTEAEWDKYWKAKEREEAERKAALVKQALIKQEEDRKKVAAALDALYQAPTVVGLKSFVASYGLPALELPGWQLNEGHFNHFLSYPQVQSAALPIDTNKSISPNDESLRLSRLTLHRSKDQEMGRPIFLSLIFNKGHSWKKSDTISLLEDDLRFKISQIPGMELFSASKVIGVSTFEGDGTIYRVNEMSYYMLTQFFNIFIEEKLMDLRMAQFMMAMIGCAPLSYSEAQSNEGINKALEFSNFDLALSIAKQAHDLSIKDSEQKGLIASRSLGPNNKVQRHYFDPAISAFILGNKLKDKQPAYALKSFELLTPGSVVYPLAQKEIVALKLRMNEVNSKSVDSKIGLELLFSIPAASGSAANNIGRNNASATPNNPSVTITVPNSAAVTTSDARSASATNK